MVEYTSYDEWKQWDVADFGRFDPRQADYYRAEVGRWVRPGARVLELGFGNGPFLGWAGEQGARLWGTEVQPPLVAAARARGVTLLDPSLADLDPALAGTFDLVVAFDVFEHLPADLTTALLPRIAALLAPGGALVARFPNAQSPLGAMYHWGDITHLTPLSVTGFRQMVTGGPLRIDRIGRATRSRGRGLRLPLYWARHRLQDAIEGLIRFAYANPTSMAPNCVVVLRRADG